MSVRISPNLPANVVEIGNEITQAKINEINAGTLALQTWVSGGYLAKTGGTLTGALTVDETATSGYTAIYSGVGISMNAGFMYISQEEGVIEGFNINLPTSGTIGNVGTITFSDSTTQTTAAVPYDTKKAIANTCAGCMYINSGYIAFDGGVALALNSSSKFSGGGQYRLGWTIGGTYNTTFALTTWTNPNGDVVAQASNGGYLSLSGERLAYSDDYGSTWTYSDFTF